MRVEKLDRNKYGINSYLIIDEKTKGALLIDPGLNFRQAFPLIDDEGLDLKSIVFTHGHYDHIADTEMFVKQWNPTLYAHFDEQDILESPEKNYSVMMSGQEFAVAVDFWLKDLEKIQMDSIILQVIHTPGHTKGSICLMGEGVLFSGDTLFSGSIGRTDLYSGSMDKMENSLNRLKELPDTLKVYSGHGGDTSIEKEKNRNPYLKRIGR